MKQKVISTGIKNLDEIINIHNSDLILIGSRPYMGKTTLSLNIAANLAINQNVPVAIFDLEISKEEVAKRILSSSPTLGAISEAPIYIDDTPGITIAEICAKCRKLKQEKNIGLIVIDYLQLVTGSEKTKDNREQEILEISSSLKELAKELDVPVIVLSQLWKEVENREDHRPTLFDFSQSSAVKEDADIVMLLYREAYYFPDSANKNMEIIIAKNNNGKLGTIYIS